MHSLSDTRQDETTSELLAAKFGAVNKQADAGGNSEQEHLADAPSAGSLRLDQKVPLAGRSAAQEPPGPGYLTQRADSEGTLAVRRHA